MEKQKVMGSLLTVCSVRSPMFADTALSQSVLSWAV